MDLRHALAAWLEARQISQNRLAELSRVPQPTIQRILSGETGSPRTDTVEKLAAALGLTYSELMAGPTDAPTTAQNAIAAGKAKLEALLKKVPTHTAGLEEAVAPVEKYVPINVYSAKAACGLGYMNDHVEIEGTFALPRTVLERNGVEHANAAIIHAEGDSMSTYICDGDLVMIDRGVRRIQNGPVYAFMIDDEVLIKRVSKGFGLITLTSDNPNKALYPDRVVPPGTDLTVLGKVVWRGG